MHNSRPVSRPVFPILVVLVVAGGLFLAALHGAVSGLAALLGV
jgi:hypothetical protein